MRSDGRGSPVGATTLPRARLCSIPLSWMTCDCCPCTRGKHDQGHGHPFAPPDLCSHPNTPVRSENVDGKKAKQAGHPNHLSTQDSEGYIIYISSIDRLPVSAGLHTHTKHQTKPRLTISFAFILNSIHQLRLRVELRVRLLERGFYE